MSFPVNRKNRLAIATFCAPLLSGVLLLLAAAAVADEPQEAGEQSEQEPVDRAERSEPSAEPADDAGTESGRRTALVSRMVVKVVHSDEARARLIEAARELNGFPTLVTDERLVLKIPPDKLGRIVESAGELGPVLEKTLEREDLTEEIAQLEGRLRSKRKILAKLRSFFDDSGVQATLRIERNMTGLVRELEEVKGRLRVVRERSQWAVLDVSFSFRKRDRVVYVHSPFEWINTVDLDLFLGGF
ncbi:MAG: DUF4349 domain-containing protein [Polyangia bacterium]